MADQTKTAKLSVFKQKLRAEYGLHLSLVIWIAIAAQ